MSRSAWTDANLLYRVRRRRDVFDAISILTTLKSPTLVWRGHRRSSWVLSPAVHRKPGINDDATTLADQTDLMDAARLRRHHVLDGWEMPDLALLAMLQHRGAATALLDVTTDPYVALYFACEASPEHDSKDGALIAIDTNDQPKNARTISFDLGHTGSVEDVLAELGNSKIGLYTPPDVSPSIRAQRGRFVFGSHSDLGYSTLPIERKDWTTEKLSKLFSSNRGFGQPPKPAVVSIEITASLKPELRDILDKSFGLNAITLFPDLHGFAAAHKAE